MTILADALVFLSLLATLGLAWSVLPQNVPHGPDRGMYGIVCVMFEVPRACFLTIALLLCVARSTPWPAAGGFQYALVVVGQIVLTIGGLMCVVWHLEGFRGGVWPWASRSLVAVPFAVAAAEVLFTLWVMNVAPRRGPEATALTRGGWIAFAATSALFVAVGGSVHLYHGARRARQTADLAVLGRAAGVAKLDADDARFAALTPADPLPAWLEFIQYDTPAATKAAAVAAIARRPTLADDVRREIATGDYLIECRALSLFARLPADVSVGLIDIFRAYGRTLVAEEEAAAAEPEFGKARDRFAFAYARAIAFADAGRALVAAGADVRPELAAIADAARGSDYDGARDIVGLYDHDRAAFANKAAR